MIRAAIVGFGNIGHFVLEAVLASPDIEAAGIVSRSLEQKDVGGIPVAREVSELKDVDVAILCSPSRAVPDLAAKLLAEGIRTVDSYDIHTTVFDVHERLDGIAKEHGTAAVMSAGWDPGSDSMIRALLEAMAPKGVTYTNFGPGMSMGHSVVARSKEGVADALSLTIPTGSGVHRRMVYVVLKEGAKFSDVEFAIKSDSYFSHDDTRVQQVPDIDALKDMGHGVLMERKGVSGSTQNQMFTFEMRINNPALTAQVMVACARASMKLASGCYTLPEIAPMDFLPGDREELIAQLV